MEEKQIGTIMDFFAKIGVAAFHVEGAVLKVGDTIHIKGHTSDCTQVVESLEVEHHSIPRIEVGEEAGMKVRCHVHEHDEVFKVTD